MANLVGVRIRWRCVGCRTAAATDCRTWPSLPHQEHPPPGWAKLPSTDMRMGRHRALCFPCQLVCGVMVGITELARAA